MRVAGIDERGAIATRGGGVELVETSGEGWQWDGETRNGSQTVSTLATSVSITLSSPQNNFARPTPYCSLQGDKILFLKVR